MTQKREAIRWQTFLRETGKRVTSKISGFSKIILDFIYPRDCLECGSPVNNRSPWHYLCDLCAERKIWKVQPPACEICGYPFYGSHEDQEELSCEQCEALIPLFNRGKTLFLLRKAGRSWIHQIKYERGRHLLKDIGTLVREREDLKHYFDHRILIPVPLHPKKERERGYNQADWIARELVQYGKNSRIEPLILRTQDRGSQTQLGREERTKNLKGSFVLAKKALISSEHSYLIVDDVFTTGATLNACAQVLVLAGARNVDVFTMGHG